MTTNFDGAECTRTQSPPASTGISTANATSAPSSTFLRVCRGLAAAGGGADGSGAGTDTEAGSAAGTEAATESVCVTLSLDIYPLLREILVSSVYRRRVSLTLIAFALAATNRHECLSMA
jgi:hypothetical protein